MNAADIVLKTIPLLYEDQYYVVFDKPPGLLVIPTPANEKRTLVNLVNLEYGDPQNCRLHPCHRLDRDTSGAIIFAKGKKNQQLMMQEFHRQRIKKKYIAFIHGKLQNLLGEISGWDEQGQRYSPGKARSKTAVTQYRILETRKSYSILEVFPLTGRTNQIRVHFSRIGHPLVGERKFAFPRDFTLKFRRPALHASEVKFEHPVLHKPVKVESALPKDMEEFLAKN